MKVLVTGGAGFIGSHLCDALLAAGDNVRVLALPNESTHNIEGHVGAGRVEVVRGNVTNDEDCATATKEVDVVYHLAALATDWGNPERIMAINAGGTAKLLRAAAGAKAKRFVLMSSLAVHDYARGYTGGDENAPRDGSINAYAVSKVRAEELTLDAHKRGDVACTIVRPGLMPFGARDRLSFYGLADAIIRGRYAHLDGGTKVLSTAYVENLAHGARCAGTHPQAAGEIFVIGDPGAITWHDWIDAIAKELGVTPPARSLPVKLARAAAAVSEAFYGMFGIQSAPLVTRYRIAVASNDLYFSPEKAQHHIGYEPRVTRSEGLKRTVEWFASVYPHQARLRRPHQKPA